MGPEEDRSSFLKDAWIHHATEEGTPSDIADEYILNPTGEVAASDAVDQEEDSAAVRLYVDIRETIRENPLLDQKQRVHLSSILHLVERACLRYAITVNDHVLAKQEKKPKEEIQSADQIRRFSHDRFIDEVNLLSRQYREAGLDNSWRNGVGSSREEIGAWGQKIADYLRPTRGGQNRDHQSGSSTEVEGSTR